MRCLTLWQPWASLIAVGAKTIETRSWATKYRGPLAIHAGQHVEYGPIGDYYCERYYPSPRHVEGCYCETDAVTAACARRSASTPCLTRDGELVEHLPLGAIVATAQLVDCVPIYTIAGLVATGIEPALSSIQRNGDYLTLINPDDHVVFDAQLPYGDFRPGRWAWLLDAVKPTTERCPACWGTALVGLCGRTDDGSDGGCVLTGGHSGPCWGEGDVASDWTPAAPCPTCCRCSCGSTDDGSKCEWCHETRTPGRCDPIPAKGHQGLWNWDGGRQ